MCACTVLYLWWNLCSLHTQHCVPHLVKMEGSAGLLMNAYVYQGTLGALVTSQVCMCVQRCKFLYFLKPLCAYLYVSVNLLLLIELIIFMHYFSSLEYSICVYFYSCVDAVPSVSVLSYTEYGLVIQWFVPRVVEHGDLRGFQITVVEINPLNDEVKKTRSFNAGRPVRAFLISTIKNPGTYRIEVRPLTGLGYGPPGTIVYTVRM